nr:MAG TPA: hypothetical protein [Caudoviricetes sp.]
MHPAFFSYLVENYQFTVTAKVPVVVQRIVRLVIYCIYTRSFITNVLFNNHSITLPSPGWVHGLYYSMICLYNTGNCW